MIWVAGHDRAIADWAAAQMPGLNFYSAYSAFGISDGDTIIGAAIFSDYYPGGNVELTYLGPGTLSRNILREMGLYVFGDLQAARITAKTPRRNAVVKKLLPRAGFDFECIQKRYYGPLRDDDALVYSFPVTKAERWLKGSIHV